MGILAPLYLAGLAALSVPLILHLVRRTPKGRQVFSSLMFLAPTPPRLTRRSRLDQILLLLLRLFALALLAFAFARPFLREADTLSMSSLPSRRVAILIDNSASLRRADLWQQSVALVEKELGQLNPQDDVALYSFSDRLALLVPFEKNGEPAPATKPDLVRTQLKTLAPTWAAGDLGSALAAVASELDASTDAATADGGHSLGQPQIVVVSDFAKGSKLQALQSLEWPQEIHVVARLAAIKQPTNAFAHLLTSDEDAPDAAPRVRVVNAAGSSGDQFFVSWKAAGTAPGEAAPAAVYVPPGQSRVVKLPRPAGALLADRLALAGDDHDFDNAHYVVPPRKQTVRLAYIGTDKEGDAGGMQYYLRLAVEGDPLRQVEVTPLPEGDSLSNLEKTGESPPEIAIVTRPISPALATELKTLAEKGGTVVIAPESHEAAGAIPALIEGITLAPENEATDDESDEYLLLGEIDFTHPLFVPFANPKYSDFTKIHFWRHFTLTGATTGRGYVTGATTGRGYVAMFDNGDPAILEQPLGKGRIVALATNWRPDDSQLALSSKFVPLVGGMLDLAAGGSVTLKSVLVNEPVAIPTSDAAEIVVRKPDGRDVKLPTGTRQFNETDQPGVYCLQAGTDEVQFAVNVNPMESDTTPLDLTQLEQLGVRMGEDLTRDEKLARERQKRDTELEDQQKVWRWLIVAVLGALIGETWWAGRAARQATFAQTEATKSKSVESQT
jgi:hypothetical protein